MDTTNDKNFEYTIDVTDEVVRIELVGYLDATNAYGLMEDLKKLIGTKVSEIRYGASQLVYIASAGLRVMVFSKQKIGYEAQVYVEKPQEIVLASIEMSGLTNFINII